nr:hypothetical protein [Tanacetum cinerariifolium]
MNHNIDFSGSDQIQNPQYPDIQENPLTNNEFEAFMKANDDKINNLEIEFDHFQKQCEQMQDDLLNQMRNFMQNFQNGPPGEDKEHEATTDTKLPSTEDIQPLPSLMLRTFYQSQVNASELAHINPEIPKSDFDFEEEIRLIKNLVYDNSFPRPPEELNAEIADTIIESIPLLPISVQDGNSQQEEIDIGTKTYDVLPPSDENDDDSSDDSLLEEFDLFLSDNSIPSSIKNFVDDPEGDIQPPDDNFNLEPEVISAVMEDIDEPDEHFNPGGEIFVSTPITY